MRAVVSGDSGAWIAPRLGSWGSVGGVAGRGFEAYARVLHPVEVGDGAHAMRPGSWA